MRPRDAHEFAPRARRVLVALAAETERKSAIRGGTGRRRHATSIAFLGRPPQRWAEIQRSGFSEIRHPGSCRGQRAREKLQGHHFALLAEPRFSILIGFSQHPHRVIDNPRAIPPDTQFFTEESQAAPRERREVGCCRPGRRKAGTAGAAVPAVEPGKSEFELGDARLMISYFKDGLMVDRGIAGIPADRVVVGVVVAV
jgi:hypothetical protein